MLVISLAIKWAENLTGNSLALLRKACLIMPTFANSGNGPQPQRQIPVSFSGSLLLAKTSRPNLRWLLEKQQA